MNDDDLLPPSNPAPSRRSAKPSGNANSNEILKAYQVNAFKYVNKQYENKGKVGLALLASKVGSNFNILLYGKSNTHITQANINSEFSITSAEELYVSFYDIKSENWSLRFDTTEYFTDFLSRMCIYKLISSNKSDLVIIDIKSGTGAKVQETDMCEIELVINSIRNNDISSIIYSNDAQDILRMQVGSNKYIPAVDRGLIGMCRGGYRVIAVSHKSNLNKGGSISIPIDTNFLIYIRLIRLKPKLEKPSPKTESKESEISLPDIDFTKSEQETESSTSKKDDLLKRLEKMVIPILPVSGESNSNENPMKNYNYNQANPIPNKEIGIASSQFPSTQQILPFHSYNPPLLQYSNPQMNPVNSFIQMPNPATSNDFSVLFTETRQNNTEMRIALSKLQDKIDRLHDKLDSKVISTQPQQPVARFMDAENVFENIKRIINENESLKLECDQKSSMIEKQNKRINELQKSSQLYLEESRDALTRTSVSMSSSATMQEKRILELEEEKLSYIRNLTQKTSEVSQLEMKLEQSNSNMQTYRSKSLEFNDQITKLSDEIGDLKLKNRSLLTELKELKDEQTSGSLIQQELETRRKQWADNENTFKTKIESLKTNLNEANSRINKIQTDCDSEINEIRRQCQQEIEDWKTKLKSERQRITNKSSDLQDQIDSLNQDWEQKLDNYQRTESGKLMKVNEKNSQLMMENASLKGEIVGLKDQLFQMEDEKSKETTELKQRNQILTDQLNETQRKLTELNNMEFQLNQIKYDNNRLIEMRDNYEELKNRNKELEQELTELIKDHGDVKNSEQDKIATSNDIEESVKSIMNNVFKKIKEEISQDSNYSGKEIVNKCMVIIRDSTMNIIGNKNEENDSIDTSEDEEEAGEDGEEEEEDNDDNSEEENERNTEEEKLKFPKILDLEIINSSNEILSKDEINIKETISDDEEVIKRNQESSESVNLCTDKPPLLLDDVNILHHSDEKILEISLKDEEIDEISVEYPVENVKMIESVDNGFVESDVPSKLQNENPNLISTEVTNTEDDPDDTPDPTRFEELEPSANLKVVESDQIACSGDKYETVDNNTQISKDPILYSDDDDDVLDFFEKLTQKTKVTDSQQNDKPKPSVLDLEDDLSWLNN